jgi:hypothetical protein
MKNYLNLTTLSFALALAACSDPEIRNAKNSPINSDFTAAQFLDYSKFCESSTWELMHDEYNRNQVKHSCVIKIDPELIGWVVENQSKYYVQKANELIDSKLDKISKNLEYLMKFEEDYRNGNSCKVQDPKLDQCKHSDFTETDILKLSNFRGLSSIEDTIDLEIKQIELQTNNLDDDRLVIESMVDEYSRLFVGALGEGKTLTRESYLTKVADGTYKLENGVKFRGKSEDIFYVDISKIESMSDMFIGKSKDVLNQKLRELSVPIDGKKSDLFKLHRHTVETECKKVNSSTCPFSETFLEPVRNLKWFISTL